MTSRLSKTPSVGTFTAAWSERFKEVVTEAAGKDGRLSSKEAARIGARKDDGSIFADNAVNYLEAKGQASVSASKLAEAGRAYAEASARVAAGPDGRISAADQTRLPQDLVLDIAVLQGRAAAPAPTPGVGEVAKRLAELTKGMQNWSESESPVVPLSGGAVGSAAITPELVAERFATTFAENGDAMAGGGRVADTAPLSQQPVTEGDPKEFTATRGVVWDVGDPAAEAYAERWRALDKGIFEALTDVKLFRFGTVEPTYVLVGRTASGELAGFMAGAVET